MDKLSTGREEYIEKLKKGEVEKPQQKNPREKWEENKKSLRRSITFYCWECVGEIKADVRDCTAYNCPLYYVRPYQIKKKGGDNV